MDVYLLNITIGTKTDFFFSISVFALMAKKKNSGNPGEAINLFPTQIVFVGALFNYVFCFRSAPAPQKLKGVTM